MFLFRGNLDFHFAIHHWNNSKWYFKSTKLASLASTNSICKDFNLYSISVQLVAPERYHLNVWNGEVGNRLIGPQVFQSHLASNRYLEFLKHHLPELLHIIPASQQVEIVSSIIGIPDILQKTFETSWLSNIRYGLVSRCKFFSHLYLQIYWNAM